MRDVLQRCPMMRNAGAEDGYAAPPLARDATRFERCGLRLGHVVRDSGDGAADGRGGWRRPWHDDATQYRSQSEQTRLSARRWGCNMSCGSCSGQALSLAKESFDVRPPASDR
ncbi:MAG: hypothetical protein U1F06_10765 [Steroidobacteraceae bacterium]